MKIFERKKSKCFFLKAEKIHDGTPEADPIEKQEEMDRMREHVMKEFDKNNDRMLSFQEFELGINGTGAKNDQGWQVKSFYSIDIFHLLTGFSFFLVY